MKNNTKTLTVEQLDQIDEIQHCLSAISALMIPCENLHVVNRDSLAILMNYFSNRLQEVTQGGSVSGESIPESRVETQERLRREGMAAHAKEEKKKQPP